MCSLALALALGWVVGRLCCRALAAFLLFASFSLLIRSWGVDASLCAPVNLLTSASSSWPLWLWELCWSDVRPSLESLGDGRCCVSSPRRGWISVQFVLWNVLWFWRAAGMWMCSSSVLPCLDIRGLPSCSGFVFQLIFAIGFSFLC
ncbi:hypothetical protein FA15DRAFT_327199 [Coprinopsis marcescibilis]|uniref:Uncharacterized protein n=1 Tax=Coprinopsis marcescibilis TaxID=230819 RepID=A0A5C3KBJ2_COPMA|nr:hypothetical protein FA15DRAFT_327199 [Coprinopsis marcescibilis]